MKKILKNYLNSRFNHYYNEGIDVTLCKEYALSDIYEVLCSENLMTEDLRKWFGQGGSGGTTKGGWDRYGAEGQKLGKCGGGKKGGAYAACLSAEKARKLGKKGRAAFVRRKRAAQKKSGDTKKGGEKKKGQKPTYSKTGA
tara:strand:+ start:583 stop:1005 length:423 start_codon:yes stop_codon:yes gene_type:complete